MEIKGNTALCQSMGMTRRVRIDFIDHPEVGEYVIVHAGFAIERLSEDQAALDLQAWEEVANANN